MEFDQKRSMWSYRLLAMAHTSSLSPDLPSPLFDHGGLGNGDRILAPVSANAIASVR